MLKCFLNIHSGYAIETLFISLKISDRLTILQQIHKISTPFGRSLIRSTFRFVTQKDFFKVSNSSSLTLLVRSSFIICFISSLHLLRIYEINRGRQIKIKRLVVAAHYKIKKRMENRLYSLLHQKHLTSGFARYHASISV